METLVKVVGVHKVYSKIVICEQTVLYFEIKNVVIDNCTIVA